MHNICKVRDSNPSHHKKKKSLVQEKYKVYPSSQKQTTHFKKLN